MIRTSFQRYRILAALALCVLGGAAAAVFHESVLDAALSTEPGSTGLAITAAILFAWFLGSQLVLAPSGTVSVVLGGVALGPLAGVLYFIAMVIAGVAVHSLARPAPREAERLVQRFAPGRFWRRHAYGAVRRIRHAPIQSTAALRLLPVAPSAACALIVTLAGASLKGMVAGTLATGWVRPLGFAIFGDQIWRVLQQPEISAAALITSPALWISLASLAGFVVLLQTARRG